MAAGSSRLKRRRFSEQIIAVIIAVIIEVQWQTVCPSAVQSKMPGRITLLGALESLQTSVVAGHASVELDAHTETL